MVRRLLGVAFTVTLVWSVPTALAQPLVEDLLQEAAVASGDGRFQAQAFFTGVDGPIDMLIPEQRDPAARAWTLGWSNDDPTDPRRVALQVLDGCDVNDHLWVFAAGASEYPWQLVVTDTQGGLGREYSFQGAAPGGPIQPILDQYAFAACDDGGDSWLPPPRLPPLAGDGSFTPRGRRCPGFTAPMAIEQSRRGHPYDQLVIRGDQVNRIASIDPVTASDVSRYYDERFVLLEGDEPGVIEGLVLSAAQGELPSPRSFADRAAMVGLHTLARAVARAREGRPEREVLSQLGAGRRACVYHLRFDLDDQAAGDLLDEAGWVLAPPVLPANDRFIVEGTSGDGPSSALPGLPPIPASGPFGPAFPFFGDEQVIAEVLDGCAFNDRYWVIAGGSISIPYELTVTDTRSGEVKVLAPPLAPPGADAWQVIDTDAFATCP